MDLKYEKIKLDDAERYLTYLSRCAEITSDLSQLIAFGYSRGQNIVRAYADGFCWQKGLFNGADVYLSPVGNWDVDNWSEILERDVPADCTFVGVPESLLNIWTRQLSPEQIASRETRNEFDYLYSIERQLQERGRGYAEFRRERKQFDKEYYYNFQDVGTVPDVVCRLVAIQDAFIDAARENKKYNESLKAEDLAFRYICENWDVTSKYLDGLLLSADGRDVGFFLWEKLDAANALALFAKFDHSYRGVYQTLLNETYRRLAERGFSIVNQMCDAGIRGIRFTKLNQHPCAFLKKYEARLTRPSKR